MFRWWPPFFKCQEQITTSDSSKQLSEQFTNYLFGKQIMHMCLTNTMQPLYTDVIIPHISLFQDDWADICLMNLFIFTNLSHSISLSKDTLIWLGKTHMFMCSWRIWIILPPRQNSVPSLLAFWQFCVLDHMLLPTFLCVPLQRVALDWE